MIRQPLAGANSAVPLGTPTAPWVPRLCPNVLWRQFARAVAAGSRTRPASYTQRASFNGGSEVTRNILVALYVVALIATIVGVDVLFFRNRLWARLLANIGIVLLFAAFYLRFLKQA
jgi:hypothetical protein